MLLARADRVDGARLQVLRDRGFLPDGERWVRCLAKSVRTAKGESGVAYVDLSQPSSAETDVVLRVDVDIRPIAELGPIGVSELFVALL